MKGVTVEVCTDGSKCKQCGLPSEVAAGQQWAVFTCGYESIRGNQIKVIQNNNYLAFCEVRITDRVIKKPGEHISKPHRFHDDDSFDVSILEGASRASNEVLRTLSHISTSYVQWTVKTSIANLVYHQEKMFAKLLICFFENLSFCEIVRTISS